MGTFSMLTVDKSYHIQQPLSQFFASQLINLEWVQSGDGKHQLFPANADIVDVAGHKLVTAYAVQRPDDQWALMIVNKDQENPHPIKLAFYDASTNTDSFFSGLVDVITFGSTTGTRNRTEARPIQTGPRPGRNRMPMQKQPSPCPRLR
jgi:hypothetical protein